MSKISKLFKNVVNEVLGISSKLQAKDETDRPQINER